MSGDAILSREDLVAIGKRIVEMADRVKVLDAFIPGMRATWVVEVDDVPFKVTVTVQATPGSKDSPLD